jgi:hypothetical protein
MAIEQLVVTPERFAQGLLWPDYMDTVKANREAHIQNYAEFELSADDKAFFERAVAKAGGLKVVVLTEDWCPDCHRNSPVMAKIADSVEGIELRVFPRDSNLDIMDRYLKDGEFRSIPTGVWADSNLGYLMHWIERSDKANADMVIVNQKVASLPEEERRPTSRRMSDELYRSSWRYEVVRETRERLAKALGIDP